MLKIRLMRIGAKKRPFYRVVAVDERNKRDGAAIEILGTYNPLTEPKEIKLNQDRIDYWSKQGAQKSDGFLKILKEAPQRPARKAKKQVEESSNKNQAEATKQDALEVKANDKTETTPEAAITLGETEPAGPASEEEGK